MISTFQQCLEAAITDRPLPVAVAAAEERELLETLDHAVARGMVRPILTGDAARIRALSHDLGHLADAEIVDVADPATAALVAARLVGEGHAEVLVKGMVNSSAFLRGALAVEANLRTGGLLSHLSVFEIPGASKLLFFSDGGMNVAPDLEKKIMILDSALEVLGALGLTAPRVAVLTANEQVSDAMPATKDAAALAELGAQGRFGDAIIEGPIALDVALDPEAAKVKGITSRVSGDVDFCLVHSIEAGNLLGKSLVHFARARMAGLVLGARRPVVLTSRSDNPEGKIYSIALACVVARATSRDTAPPSAGTEREGRTR